ncbi:UDP-N-acetylmuramoyl-L-alanyl-D-glutamate--2,6-diaminopimelate ligase [Caenispirillum salinarum]|uniref:UDP-N-acetylmuramoyl-L-alanyl-D-glutamate--2, 6-diaminopimelate ligase n=1 Tax=Caenispirillum salinarum TaxID=859058 RepID=UPI00384EE5E4
MRSLTDLIRASGAMIAAGEDRTEAVTVSGLTADSRAVGPGAVFAALPGAKVDGRDFIAQAVQAGAVAVLAPTGTTLPKGVEAVLLTHDAPRLAFSLMAAAFHGRQPETVAAVTGTNGKTSTVNFARQLWTALGMQAASLGTLGVVGPDWTIEGKLTTPDPERLHALLADIADRGVTHLCMEASSHGLDQHRLSGVMVAAGGFTNLSRDHLDYHGTMEAYLAAKAKLFGEVMHEGGTAVLNADIPEFPMLKATAEARGLRVIDYGRDAAAIKLLDIARTAHGQRLTLVLDGGEPLTVELPLAGTFQVENALCALGLVIGCGAEAMRAARALETLSGVAGRLQLVATRANGAAVYVDYAHTPDALETVLEALRPHAAGRLVCVFGAGGDRDPGKRPLMGEAAAKLADVAIVTDDNPRTEAPATIRSAVMEGCPEGLNIGDRRAAIAEGVRLLGPGDVLLVAGKGHETGQTVGTVVHPFDDAAEARAAVEAADGRVA